MNTIAYQQNQQPQPQRIDLLKVTFLFLTLGVSAYLTYRISKSLAQEITNHIDSNQNQ